MALYLLALVHCTSEAERKFETLSLDIQYQLNRCPEYCDVTTVPVTWQLFTTFERRKIQRTRDQYIPTNFYSFTRLYRPTRASIVRDGGSGERWREQRRTGGQPVWSGVHHKPWSGDRVQESGPRSVGCSRRHTTLSRDNRYIMYPPSLGFNYK